MASIDQRGRPVCLAGQTVQSLRPVYLHRIQMIIKEMRGAQATHKGRFLIVVAICISCVPTALVGYSEGDDFYGVTHYLIGVDFVKNCSDIIYD